MSERTRRDIVDAFNRLISKYELEQISVLDIYQEAGISKATFYRYYKDKYDVMNYNYKTLLDACFEKCTNYKDLFYNLYLYAQTNWKHMHRAFNSTGINSFENYIYSYSMSKVEEITRQNRGGQGFTPTEVMQVDIFCYGISYMYKKWTLGKYAISASEAAELLYAMMPESLKHYWYID